MALLCVAAALCIVRADPSIQDTIRIQKTQAPILASAVSNADKIELISLDPVFHRGSQDEPGIKRLDRWKIIGQVTIDDKDEIRHMASALQRAIEHSNGDSALCFDPRHAIRFRSGSREIVVIACFKCQFAEIRGFENLQSATIAHEFEKEWDQIFKKHGLPKAP